MIHAKPLTRESGRAERAAAVMALVTLFAAIILLVAGAVRNWAGLLLAVAGVLVAVMAGWYVASRRGVVRVIALAVVAASVAAVTWDFVVSEVALVRVVPAVGLAMASVGCARVALRRTKAAHLVRARAAPAAGRAAHPVLIINPRSGGGKAERFHLVDQCQARGIEPIVLHKGDDLVQLAETAIGSGADVIGMAGGDGSQALVASVAARHQIPHVVIPAGTRNHFALDLGLDREDVAGALDAFADGVERRIDLAEVNGRVFVNNASLGLYAKIVQSPDYRQAKLRTSASMLPGLLGPGAEPLDLRFAGPNGTSYPTAHLILVSNNAYQLDHIGGRGTREWMDLGTLGVVAARIDGPSAARRFVALEAAGQVRRFEGWLEWETPRFRIESGGPVELGIDGEALTMAPPLDFSSRPGALLVRLPRHASAVSPAAAAIHILSRSTIAQLAGIAAGHGVA